MDYTRHYRKWHDDSPEHERAMTSHYLKLLGTHLPASHDVSILDLGCGMGFTLLALKAQGYARIEGWDLDPGQVAAAQARGLNVALSPDSIAKLHDRPGCFDLVICLDVIEHIPVSAQLEFTRAIAAALKPAGRLICSVPNANSALHGRWRYIDWTHTSSFTEHSLDFLLFNAGFSTIQIHEAEADRTPQNRWLPIRGTRNWWLWRAFRAFRRLEMIAEFGREAGCAIPLSLNLLATADKE